MAFLYVSNLDPTSRLDQLEIQLDNGSTAILRRGHSYDLTVNELARARRYVVMSSTGVVADEEPIGITRLPVKGNPTQNQLPQWSENDGAFVPATVSGVSGGPYASVASLTATQADVDALVSRNSINVKAAPYNAVGDGVTDDTAAIQAAITAAAVNLGKGGCDVVIPVGTYLISSALLMKYNTRLIGQSGRGATMIKASASGNFTNGSRSAFPAMIKWDGGDGWAHGVQLRGFQLNTNGIAGLSGTWFQGPGENFLFDDLRCDSTAPVTRQVTDAQLTAGSRVVTFTSSTVTEEDVNARITTGGSVAAPAAPVPTTSTSGGSIAASKQVTVAVTYVTADGQTAPSATGGVTTGAGTTNKVTVPSPSAATGATGWVAYANNAGFGKLVRQGGVNAIGTPLDITTLPDGSVSWPTAVTPYQKIDYPNWAANSNEASKTTVTMREPAVATLSNVTLTIARPTDAFVFDMTTVGAATGRIGFINGNNNSGALLRFKGLGAGTWLIDVLSGDDNGGGLLRLSRGAITGNPANITIGQIKAENQSYNPNYQWNMDPVVLFDRCWTVNLNVLGGTPVTTGYARDFVRLDHSWATADAGGPSMSLMGLEGQNWFNTAYTNLLSDTKSGEVVPVSSYGEQSPYPMVLWNKKLKLAGGSELPDMVPWSQFIDVGWRKTPLAYNGAVPNWLSGLVDVKSVIATSPWDPASIADGAMTSTTITVSGAQIGDPVGVGFSNAVPAGALLTGQVTATNTVTVTLFNKTGAALDLASGTLHVTAWRGAGTLTGRIMYSQTNAQNDGFGWYVPLSKGNWMLSTFLYGDATGGIVTFDISFDNGSSWTAIGTVDTYRLASQQIITPFENITVPKTGRAILRGQVLSRNASNTTGWQQEYTAFTWTRTS
jgi:hypothetical protein